VRLIIEIILLAIFLITIVIPIPFITILVFTIITPLITGMLGGNNDKLP
jgi:hypothetical protein